MKLVIGLVGEKGGGKGTFQKILMEMLPNKKISCVRFSDVLTDTLKLWNLPLTRENYQKLSPAMRKAYGPEVVARATYQRADPNADIIILDGIRWQADVDLLRSLPNNLLIYITAGAKTRYERSKARKEKAGEDQTTLEQFLTEEQAETELLIPTIGMGAEIKIGNNGSMEEIKNEVANFLLKWYNISAV